MRKVLQLISGRMDQVKKIALITGAGSGIGKAAAVALSKNNWTVILTGRRKSALEDTADKCSENQSKVITSDITDPNSVAALFEEVKQEFNRLDLMFNNAGIRAPTKLLEEITLSEWQEVIETNVTGSFLCSQEAFKLMKAQNPQGGRIINNGSISAHVPRPLSTPYTVSKHAITGLTKSCSLDGRAFKIVCGQIDIGNAATDMTEKMDEGVMQANGEEKVEPTMDVMNVADAVVYMASLPLDTNVPFITVMANEMPYMGRG